MAVPARRPFRSLGSHSCPHSWLYCDFPPTVVVEMQQPDPGIKLVHSPTSQDIVNEYLHSLPPRWSTPLLSSIGEASLHDLYRGCLLWGAVGDALGRPAERWSPRDLRQQFGPDGIRDYVPWPGWSSGPTGTFTDDTQLTMAVARSLCAQVGPFNPEQFARELVVLRPNIRGIGRATSSAIARSQRGEPWWNAGSGENSAGNGGCDARGANWTGASAA
jgi:hypothetical protein